MIFYAQRREQALIKKFINQVAIEIIESRKEKAKLLDKEVEEKEKKKQESEDRMNTLINKRDILSKELENIFEELGDELGEEAVKVDDVMVKLGEAENPLSPTQDNSNFSNQVKNNKEFA